MKEKFMVEGMTCAACQAHVEKAVKKVDGVNSVSVNLLTNSMEVDINDLSVVDKINKSVEAAGYKSYLKNKKQDNTKNEELSNSSEVKKLTKRLIFSFILLIPLFYFSMGFMMNWPIGLFKDNLLALGLFLMIDSFIRMLINKAFFISGFKSLIHGGPNMDTLVALGSGVSFIYSVVILFIMTANRSNDHHLMKYAMNLTFETAGMVPTLITIGKLLEAISKGKTTNALKALINLKPKTAHVIRNDKEEIINASELRVNDIFVVYPGEAIPTDGIVIGGESAVDESSLTGESLPVDKNINDKLFEATINQNGILKCIATSVGEDTSLSKIIKMVMDVNQSKAKISKIADKVAGIFVPIVLLIASLGFIIWMIIGSNINLNINEELLTYSINRAIAVLVISCPCALGLATPVAIMVGSGLGAKNGILYKNAEIIEEAGKINFVVLDKTGTITNGKPEVIKCISLIEENEFLKLAYSLEKNSSHPLAISISNYCNNLNIDTYQVSEFNTLVGKGIKCIINNKEIYGINLKYAKELINIDSKEIKEIEELSSKGITPMIFIYDNKLIGIIGVADKIKDDSANAIIELKKKGVIPIMLTGDNNLTAKAIAKEANIDYFISDVLPEEKKNIIEKLKKQGKVMMVGDGINDALALTYADVGVAIGAGSDVAIDSASIVLIKSSLMDLVKAISLSRQILKNIKENLFWAFFYNLIMIPIALGVFYFTNIEWLKEMKPWYGALAMSFSSVFVVMNALRLNLFNPLKNKNNRKTIDFDINSITKKEDNNMKEVISVEGMMCKMCVKHVEEACLKIDGVLSAKADLDKKEVFVETNKDNLRNALIDSINNAGYQAK